MLSRRCIRDDDAAGLLLGGGATGGALLAGGIGAVMIGLVAASNSGDDTPTNGTN